MVNEISQREQPRVKWKIDEMSNENVISIVARQLGQSILCGSLRLQIELERDHLFGWKISTWHNENAWALMHIHKWGCLVGSPLVVKLWSKTSKIWYLSQVLHLSFTFVLFKNGKLGWWIVFMIKFQNHICFSNLQRRRNYKIHLHLIDLVKKY